MQGPPGTPKHSARTGRMAGRASASSSAFEIEQAPSECTVGAVAISSVSGPEASRAESVCVLTVPCLAEKQQPHSV